MDDELAKVYAAIDAVEDGGTERLDFGRIRDAVTAYAAIVGGRTLNEIRQAQGLPAIDTGHLYANLDSGEVTVDELRAACQHPTQHEVTTYADRGEHRRAYYCEACQSKWFEPDEMVYKLAYDGLAAPGVVEWREKQP